MCGIVGGLDSRRRVPNGSGSSGSDLFVARDEPDIGTPFQKWLVLRWEMLDDGSDGVSVEMNMRDDLRGPAGSLEGGVVSTLADVAGASAIARTVGMVATQHVALSFLAPGRVGPIRATAVPLRFQTS